MIYLINPSETDILDTAGDRMPLGLMSIGANLKKNGLETKLFDLNHDDINQMIKQAQEDNPKVVGISAYTSANYNKAAYLSKRFRELFPKTRLVVGGHHATAMPYECLEHFNTVVRGEGEIAILNALYQDGIITALPSNLNHLPNPDRSLINSYKYGINQNGKRTATLITSRGCPYSCAFCGNFTHMVRYEPIEKVKKQLQEITKEEFESVYFLDDVFTIRKERMKTILNETKLPYRLTTRANFLDPERMDILADCELLSFGVESGNQDVLNRINKRENLSDFERAQIMAKARNIKTKGFFIIGLPGETQKTASDTINFALRLKDMGMNYADFYYLVPFPGTPIWNNPESFGIKIKDRDFTKYLQAGKRAKCVIETEELSSSDIEDLVEEAKYKWKN